jgi:hypothetical protein
MAVGQVIKKTEHKKHHKMWFAGKDCCKTGTKNKVVVHNTTTARQ